MDTAANEERIEALINELTLGEKVALAAGIDAWHTAAIPRLGIPSIKVTDGPNGARGETFGGVTAAYFPCGTALGATWDPELAREVGAAIAQEARTKQCRVLLAPTVNIHRHPLAGRNFECYSEDPLLSARMATEFIRGVQSQGVAATIKHFVCNDSEFERMTISSEVPERALREIYLAPFEEAVREAHPWAAMTAYNRINGTHACQNEPLIGVLKDEWGWDGLLMSDWWGTRSTIAAANAGLDLEMPGPAHHFGDRLRQALNSGEVAEATVDDKVRRLLRLALRTGAFVDVPAQEQGIDRPEHRELMRREAAASMVLLKNDGAALPLGEDVRSIALIGPNAVALSMGGGGSSRVEPHHGTSVLESLTAALPGVDVTLSAGCVAQRRTPPLSIPSTAEYYASAEFEGPPAFTQEARRMEFRWLGTSIPGGLGLPFSLRARGEFRAEVSGVHRFTLTSAGLSSLLIDGELAIDNWTNQRPGTAFYGRGSAEETADITLTAGQVVSVVLEYQSPPSATVPGVSVGCKPPAPADQMERAVEAARAADAAVVVVGLNADWESEGSDRVSLSLPGDQDELVRRVAAVNKRTVVVINAGSPVATPWADDVPAIVQAWYPGQEGGDAIAAVLSGAAEPGGRLPTTFPRRIEDAPSHLTYPGEAGSVEYGEGIFVGYRGYERAGREPLFPFGHGLSYTIFEWGEPTLDKQTVAQGESVTVTVLVKNIGSRSGSAVVQVYVRDVESSLMRPEKELKGFGKATLASGEERKMAITLAPRAFAAWHPGQHGWVAEPGEFEILVGASAADIRGRCRVLLK